MASGGERQRRLIRGEPKTLSTLSPFRPRYPKEPVLKHGIRPPRGRRPPSIDSSGLRTRVRA